MYFDGRGKQMIFMIFSFNLLPVNFSETTTLGQNSNQLDWIKTFSFAAVLFTSNNPGIKQTGDDVLLI